MILHEKHVCISGFGEKVEFELNGVGDNTLLEEVEKAVGELK